MDSARGERLPVASPLLLTAVRMRHGRTDDHADNHNCGRTHHTHERKQSSRLSRSYESGRTDRSDIHRIVIPASFGKRGDRSIVNSTIAGSGTTALSFGAVDAPPSR